MLASSMTSAATELTSAGVADVHVNFCHNANGGRLLHDVWAHDTRAGPVPLRAASCIWLSPPSRQCATWGTSIGATHIPSRELNITAFPDYTAMGQLTETNRVRALEELEAMEVDSDAEQAEDELGEKSDEHLGEKLVEQDAVPKS
ncbi:hypothetical protein B0H11DRAFT_2251970 [Mycena galericulata]|nr:hypothetical protein B0H11DRAFT_2251970 [Mycena galericulata]